MKVVEVKDGNRVSSKSETVEMLRVCDSEDRDEEEEL